MAWVYAPEGHCYLNTNYIQQIIPQSAGTGQMEALYDDEWVHIEDKWYEYPPELKPVPAEVEMWRCTNSKQLIREEP